MPSLARVTTIRLLLPNLRFLLLTTTLGSAAATGPVVTIETSLGRIVVELEPEKAPKTVENFLEYVRAGFYDGTIFHRVVPTFIIQGGGYTPSLKEKETRDPILNEASKDLKNLRGTIAMARTDDPHSATSQFFINLSDNKPLDHRSRSARQWGYAVFGKVISGLEVADSIGDAPTTGRSSHRSVPIMAITIERIWIQ